MKRLPAQHHLGAALFGWVGLPMMMALLWGQPKDGAAAAWCVGNGALGMVALGASVAIHELAHAAVAVLLRLEVASVSIGVGPVISRRRVRAVDVALHTVPTAGLVMLVANSRRWLRTRVWWTIFAGPAVNLGIAAVVLSWLASTGGNVARVEFTSGLAWWLVFGATNLGVGALNIFPSGSTDGAQLLSGLFGGHDADRTLGAGHLHRGDRALAAGRYDEALAEAEAARPLLKKDGWACDHLVVLVALERGDAEQAVPALRALLHRGTLDARQAAIVGNNLAWALVMRGAPDDAAEAIDRSAAALAALPGTPACHGTHGAALIAAGRAADGLPHSQRGMVGASSDRNRAVNHAWIAIGHAQLGDRAAAQASLDAARRLHADHPLVLRAAAALA